MSCVLSLGSAVDLKNLTLWLSYAIYGITSPVLWDFVSDHCNLIEDLTSLDFSRGAIDPELLDELETRVYKVVATFENLFGSG